VNLGQLYVVPEDAHAFVTCGEDDARALPVGHLRI